MPSSPSDSSGSPPPSATPSPGSPFLPAARGDSSAAPVAWRANVWLFLATVVSAFVTWADPFRRPATRSVLIEAVEYTAALMAILLAHEFGHYVAARIHRVDASLPYFIPMPFISPFGTMGAVIRMRSVIPTRPALLDIGAAGPLAGLALALPLYAWGVAHSPVVAVDGSQGSFVELGSSLLSRALDFLCAAPVPQGHDLLLSPIAFAGWVGMFVTMINLLPVGQLDAGHVAYALFGPRQNVVAQWVHRSMLAFFFVSLGSFVVRDLRAGIGLWHFGEHVNQSMFWLFWFEVLAILGVLSGARSGETDRLGVLTRVFAMVGLAIMAALFREFSSVALWVGWFLGLGVLLAMEVRGGALRSASSLLDHPPTGDVPLGPGRTAIAVLTLVFFVLLFMPTPMSL